MEEEDSNMESAIEDTTTFTTVQRPDIVLRLSKNSYDDIVYTYLFDAKYRLADKRIKSQDVPPVDAINQMHRYRDAIYYNSLDNGIKREVVGGYVLYPGNLTADQVKNSYYHDSHEKIGIGAFPLKPGGTIVDEQGNPMLDPMSSESVLYEQIREWLSDTNRRQKLLDNTIPQKGLEYSDADASYLIVTAFKNAGNDLDKLKEGTATKFFYGNRGPLPNIDLQSIKFLAPVMGHNFHGYYRVKGIKVTEEENQEYPFRFKIDLGEYTPLPNPVLYGIDTAAARGVKMKAVKFKEFCNKANSPKASDE